MKYKKGSVLKPTLFLVTLYYLLFTVHFFQTILLNNFSRSLKLKRIHVGRPWGQFEGWSHVSS